MPFTMPGKLCPSVHGLSGQARIRLQSDTTCAWYGCRRGGRVAVVSLGNQWSTPFRSPRTRFPSGFHGTCPPPTRRHQWRHPATSPTHSSDSSALPQVEACDALIVGAGPAGLGTALLLAQREEWRKIIILELRSSIDAAEPDKSYVYSIDGRGRALTDVAGVTAAVEAAGVVSMSTTITRVMPDGTAKTSVVNIKDHTRPNVWLSRTAFLAAMRSGLVDAERDGRVSLLHGMQVTDIRLAPGARGQGNASAASDSETSTSAPGVDAMGSLHAWPVVVHSRDVVSGREVAFMPRLLVGADGINSRVRGALDAWTASAGLPADHFKPVVLDSPAAGLRFKVLRMPPNTPFRKPPAPSAVGAATGSGTVAGRLDNPNLGLIVGVKAPRTRAMRLGFLPVKGPAAPRTANLILTPDHVAWSMTTGPQLRDFLQESFPQLDIPTLLGDDQLEAVAASRGGVFPAPQYLRHFTAVIPAPQHQQLEDSTMSTPSSAAAPAAPGGGCAAASTCGVALVGDAVHSFPPDLGQGVNSAMQDVLELVKSLDEAKDDVAEAMKLYETRRAPEAAALAQLMTFSLPYQYNQDPLRRTLSTWNVLLRMVMSRLASWVFSPHSMLLLQQQELTYVQVLERAHATTARLWALLGVVVAAAVALVLKAVAA